MVRPIFIWRGIPSAEMAANPGTARVAKLGKDMQSLEGEPVVIADVPYLFEDSGINKINGRYYYSYCSNFPYQKIRCRRLDLTEVRLWS